MRIFLSWSGPTSRGLAEVFQKYLPLVLQGTQTFMSQHDIESGEKWLLRLSSELEASSFGIAFLTPSNLKSPWINFETGALTKHADGRACCLLFAGLSHADVEPPLSGFQNQVFARAGVEKLVRDVNATSTRLPAEQLRMTFEKWWDDLAGEVSAVLERDPQPAPPRRSTNDLLEEILSLVRDIDRDSAARAPRTTSEPDLMGRAINFDSLSWYTLWKYPNFGISEYWQRRLLDDLDRSRYPTIGDLNRVVDRARTAVEAYREEMPEWFRSGTDFITKSLGFVDADFRGRHGFAERTRAAFDRHAHLLGSSPDGGAS